MSVINKMLRDLDGRKSVEDGQPTTTEQRHALAQGTFVVSDTSRRNRRLLLPVILLTSILFFIGVAAWWQQIQPRDVAGKVGTTESTSLNSSSETKDEEVVSAVQATVAPTVSVNDEPLDTTASEETLVRPVAEQSSTRISRSSAVLSLRVDNTFKSPPRVSEAQKTSDVAGRRPVSAPPVVASTSGPVSTAPVTAGPMIAQTPQPSAKRVDSIKEALAQAQNLWNVGSREPAMVHLRQTLGIAERAYLNGSVSEDFSALTSLIRELARMELAEGQVSRAMQTLTRMESVVSGSADVWAMRGNAAQRLGRHAESVSAYLEALKIRPDETRWMLGAAVSLAVQGHTASAAEWAEMARNGGALSPELATYLRQLGVPLRER